MHGMLPPRENAIPYVYSFLERIFNLFAKFATDFGNVNIMTGLHPLVELNTKLSCPWK
jgi:hypothetical protein